MAICFILIPSGVRFISIIDSVKLSSPIPGLRDVTEL